MKNTELKRLMESISRLSALDIATVKDAISTQEKQMASTLVASDLEQSVEVCPHCHCTEIANVGSKGGRKRFKCKSCFKTFNAWTKTPIARLRKVESHMAYANCMIKGYTVRDCAALLGVNKNTAFLWRHRFLDNIEKIQPKALTGIVEADETYFLESFKGQRTEYMPRKSKKRATPAEKRGLSVEQIPVLVARVRGSGKTLSVVIPSTSAKNIGNVIKPKLAHDAELISDSAPAYRNLAKKYNIAHRSVPRNKNHKTKGTLHINNVNAYDQRLKDWMDRFKGIATKYLPHYIGWHRYMENHKESLNNKDFVIDSIKGVR